MEYQFPAVLHPEHQQQPQPGRGARAVGVVGRGKLPGSYELMRIASKKMKDGGTFVSCAILVYLY